MGDLTILLIDEAMVRRREQGAMVRVCDLFEKSDRLTSLGGVICPTMGGIGAVCRGGTQLEGWRR